MNGELQVAAQRRRTRAEVRRLVTEFVSSGMRRKRVLPESRFELQHAGSPSEEAAVEEEDEKHSRGQPSGASGSGHQKIVGGARTELRAGRCVIERAPDRSAARILSVVESCRRLKLPIRAYLAAVLPGLADLPIRRLPELIPAAWVTQHPQAQIGNLENKRKP